jgi:hypothetical protein
MAAKSALTALVLAAALAGCAELTAKAPLFAPADQIGPAPLTEGVWIAVGEDCPAYYARRRSGRFPSDCAPIEIRRIEDGAWRIQLRIDLISNLSAKDRADAEAQYGPIRAVIAPAVERPPADGYSPLYVAELNPRSEDDRIGYAVIAPIGVMPATSALVIGSIGCADILRDGPIAGVSEQYAGHVDDSGQERRDLTGCVASTQAAVREAARRSVIENLDEMQERRFTFVRPN